MRPYPSPPLHPENTRPTWSIRITGGRRVAVGRPIAFVVTDVLGGSDTAVALGSFASEVGRTGRTFAGDFAVIGRSGDGRITSYRIIEDSFAISRAWRA